LLFLKLNAYGLSKSSLNLLCSYLTNRKQCVKLNQNLSANQISQATTKIMPFFSAFFLLLLFVRCQVLSFKFLLIRKINC
jgi:hypothetical protein